MRSDGRGRPPRSPGFRRSRCAVSSSPSRPPRSECPRCERGEQPAVNVAVGSQDRRLAHVEGPSGSVRHAAARLLDEEGAGGDVPRLGALLPVAVQPAGGDAGQRESRAEGLDVSDPQGQRGDPLAQRLGCPRRNRRATRRRWSPPDGAGATRRSGGRSARRRARARPRTTRRGGGRRSRSTPGCPGAPGRSAPRRRGGRPRTPMVPSSGSTIQRPSGPSDRAPFLAEEADAGKPAVEEPADAPLGGGVRLRDRVLGRLEADGPEPADAGEEQVARRLGRGDGRAGLRRESCRGSAVRRFDGTGTAVPPNP